MKILQIRSRSLAAVPMVSGLISANVWRLKNAIWWLPILSKLVRDAAAADEIRALNHGVDVVGMACDVTDMTQITALADKAWAHFGHVDILFNNAGVGVGLKSGDKTEDDDLRWIFEVNFFGNWNMCMEFLRRFKAQGSEAHICTMARKIPSQLADALSVGL